MTVGELIEKLKEFPNDYVIEIWENDAEFSTEIRDIRQAYEPCDKRESMVRTNIVTIYHE